MTGLILAGVDPVDAVKVQAAVMFMILGAVAITVTVVGLRAHPAAVHRPITVSCGSLARPSDPEAPDPGSLGAMPQRFVIIGGGPAGNQAATTRPGSAPRSR